MPHTSHCYCTTPEQRRNTKNEQNGRKRLSPRQIINRYRKGEYIDESIEAISSTISSCPYPLDNIAVPFPMTIIEMVYQNINLGKAMHENRKKGMDIEDIKVPDYPQLRDILTELSEPLFWESMMDEKGIEFMDLIISRKLRNKYTLDSDIADASKIESLLSSSYREKVQETGLCPFTLDMVLVSMLKFTRKKEAQ